LMEENNQLKYAISRWKIEEKEYKEENEKLRKLKKALITIKHMAKYRHPNNSDFQEIYSICKKVIGGLP